MNSEKCLAAFHRATDGENGCVLVTFAVEKSAFFDLAKALQSNAKHFEIRSIKSDEKIKYEQTQKKRFFAALNEAQIWMDFEIISAAGSDDDFQKFCKARGCVEGDTNYLQKEKCAGAIVFAHVRRVNRGAGVAIKPKYSGVGLCDAHHCLQHSAGESRLIVDLVEKSEFLRMLWFWSRLHAIAKKPDVDCLTVHDVATWAMERGVFWALPEKARAIAKALAKG